MFQAISKKDNRLIFSHQDPEVINAYKNDSDLYCPHTDIPLTWKRASEEGMLKRPHFARLPNAGTQEQIDRFDAIYKIRTDIHREIQFKLLKELTTKYKAGIESGVVFIKMEEPINKDQRADIYIKNGDREQAIEVQRSAITLEKLIRRTELYISKGIEPIWIFKDKIAVRPLTEYLDGTVSVYGTYEVKRETMKFDSITDVV